MAKCLFCGANRWTQRKVSRGSVGVGINVGAGVYVGSSHRSYDHYFVCNKCGHVKKPHGLFTKFLLFMLFPAWLMPYIFFCVDKKERSIFKWFLYICLFPFMVIYWFITSERFRLEKKWRWLVVAVFLLSFVISIIVFTEPVIENDVLTLVSTSQAGELAMIIIPIALPVITYNILKYRRKIKEVFINKSLHRE